MERVMHLSNKYFSDFDTEQPRFEEVIQPINKEDIIQATGKSLVDKLYEARFQNKKIS